MKKNTFIIFLLLVIAAQAQAYDFKSDGLCYNIINYEEPYEVEVTYEYKTSSTDPKGNYEGLTSAIIPETVTNPKNNQTYVVKSISDFAFCYCKDLTSITIPKSVTSVGGAISVDGATVIYNFLSSKLTDINVDNDNAYFSSTNGILFNKNKTEIICYPKARKGAYIIPDGVVRIGDLAFCECYELSSITIPNGVIDIGPFAFMSCYGLTTVTIPDGVKNLGVHAFNGCKNLTSITLPGSINEIPMYCFSNCEFTSITIPEGVKTIDSSAFWNCHKLASISIPESVIYVYKTICSGLLEYAEYLGNEKNPYLCCMGPTHPLHEQADEVTEYTINNECKVIAGSAFAIFYENLASIIIPNSITSIGPGAFSECKSLQSVVIPKEVTYIGDQAFENCKNLTIYSEAPSKPDGWDNSWNPDKCQVYYNCKNLTLSTNNDKNGSASADGVLGYGNKLWYANGATATLTATPKENCHVKWDDNTTANIRTIEMTDNKSVTATFEACTPAPGIDKAPTCTAKGLKAGGSLCSVCGHIFEAQEEIDMIPHSFTNYQYNEDATVDADGTETAYCDYGCGTSNTRTVEGTRLQNPTDIGTLSADELTISISGHRIVVENATEDIYIYDAIGHQLAHQSPMTQNVFEMHNHGVYFVKCGNKSKKVVIK
ncbi:MAG: leucine-rich repeat domain-containing protein [Bacteroidales bacterium]|nr:leucine-rich repeat domain-containing protein [Bacteroidales bacterium]